MSSFTTASAPPNGRHLNPITGWPAYVGLAFVLAPFLLGTRNRWDYFCLACALLTAQEIDNIGRFLRGLNASFNIALASRRLEAAR